MQRYAVAMHSQTSSDNGSMNWNNSGGSFLGFTYKMLIPNVMNGIVKSTTRRRSNVMVRSQMAKSAFCIYANGLHLYIY